MSTSNAPRQIYLFSDTFGNSGGEYPFDAPDADALIATDKRSFPYDAVRREFDITGRPKVTDHILRHIVRLHEELEHARYIPDGRRRDIAPTGVLINSAPRTEAGKNGDPFYIASLIGGRVRVVAPIHALSAIKEKVERLDVLPNDGQVLYGLREQFRSSFIGYLLDPEHGVPVNEAGKDDIPDPPQKWTVAYVDKFGHVITHDARPREEQRLLARPDILQQQVRLRIGNVTRGLRIVSSLADAIPGELVAYGNESNVDVLRKWRAQWDEEEKRKTAAYTEYSKPSIGDEVSVVEDRVVAELQAAA